MRRSMQLLLVLALTAALPACLFDTREPSPPPVGGGSNYVPLIVPDAPFLAITTAFHELKNANYEHATSEKFVFSPTLQDSLDQAFQGTSVYSGWNKTVELDVVDLLLADAQVLKADFSPETPPLVNKTNFVRWRTPYTLMVINKAAPTDTLRFGGVAQIDVRLENGNWRVTFWDEVETVAGVRTWGYLRGILRLRLNP
jgi:hypothetical protein